MTSPSSSSTTTLQQQIDDLKQQGNTFFGQGNLEKAIEFYTQAIDLDCVSEASAPIYSNRSLCYFNLKKYEKAFDDGSLAAGLRPDWPKGFLRRANAAAALLKWETSLEAFEEYFKLEPNPDEEAKKSKNRVQKEVDKIEAQRRREERELERKRNELMSIKDASKRRIETTTFLLDAIRDKKIDQAKVAIDCGADLLCGSPSGETVLSLAALSRNRPMVRLLVEEVQKQKLPLKGTNALDGALLWDFDNVLNPDVVLFLLNTDEFDVNREWSGSDFAQTFSLLHLAVRPSGDTVPIYQLPKEAPFEVVESVQHLLNYHQRIDINSLDDEGRTALMCSPFANITRLLIKHGASVNAIIQKEGDLKGWSVLDQAVFQGRSEVVKVLIGAGAKFNFLCAMKTSSIACRFAVCDFFTGDPPSPLDEDALRLVLQLHANQGLTLWYFSETTNSLTSFLASAVGHCAPPKIIDMLCAMDPTAINAVYCVPGSTDGPMPPFLALCCFIRRTWSDLQELMRIFSERRGVIKGSLIASKEVPSGTFIRWVEVVFEALEHFEPPRHERDEFLKHVRTMVINGGRTEGDVDRMLAEFDLL